MCSLWRRSFQSTWCSMGWKSLSASYSCEIRARRVSCLCGGGWGQQFRGHLFLRRCEVASFWENKLNFLWIIEKVEFYFEWMVKCHKEWWIQKRNEKKWCKTDSAFTSILGCLSKSLTSSRFPVSAARKSVLLLNYLRWIIFK